MPYVCSAGSGRVTLTPSRDEAYRIYGAREQRQFTTCSPFNPNLCRTWLLHRFDLDCGGVRVPWLAVIAAASEQMTGRAWVENGHLRLRMGPFWGMGPGDGPPGPPERWRGRFQGEYTDRRAHRSRAVVEMPAGFAPALGIPARFTPAPAPYPEISSAAPAPVRPTPARPTQNEPAREARPSSAPAPAPEALIAPPVPAKPTPPKLQPPREAAVKDVPVAKSQPNPAPAATPGTSITPRIINRPAPVEAPAERPAETIAPALPPKSAAPTAKPVETNAATPSAARESQAPFPGRQDTEIAKSSETRAPPTPHALTATPDPSRVQAFVAFAGLVTAMLALFAWTKRRERLRLAAVGHREIGSVSFEGAQRPRASGGALTATRSPVPDGSAQPPASAPFQFQAPADWLPRTRAEACQLLGASPDASDAAIKKIVDGLRQSWHPDLAMGEADRQVREQRMKQVNAAWDIINGKRPMA